MSSERGPRNGTSNAPIFDLREWCLKALRVTRTAYVGDQLSACTSNG